MTWSKLKTMRLASQSGEVEAPERIDGERPGDVVRHRDIDFGDDRVSGVNRRAPGAG